MESSICRQYAVWSKLRIFCKAMRSTFTVFTSAIKESIKGYATWKLWCGWAAIKGGDRPTRLLPHSKKLLVPIRFFPLLGRLCSGRFYIFTEQMWFSLLVSRWEVSAHIDLLWFLFVVGRIFPLMQEHFLWSLLKRKAFYCGWTRVLIFCQVLFGSE